MMLRDVLLCESRPDRPYDEQGASTVVVRAEGRYTLAATFDRELSAAMTLEVLRCAG